MLTYYEYHQIPYNKSDIAIARGLFWDFDILPADPDDTFYFRPNSWACEDEGVELNDYQEQMAEMLAAQLAAIRNFGPGPCDRCQTLNTMRPLWEDMWPLGYYWWDLTGRFPSGQLPKEMTGKVRQDLNGKYFIYAALNGIGREFSDEHFEEQFAIMCENLPRTRQASLRLGPVHDPATRH